MFRQLGKTLKLKENKTSSKLKEEYVQEDESLKSCWEIWKEEDKKLTDSFVKIQVIEDLNNLSHIDRSLI